jgi:hypothetical protein
MVQRRVQDMFILSLEALDHSQPLKYNQAMNTPPSTTPAEPLQHRLSRAAERFRDTVRAVIERVPIATKKPAEFERVLKLDRSLSSRLLRAVRLHDPLATLHRMPGLHGVRLLLGAAAKAGVDSLVIAQAERALIELEGLVTSELGEWKELNAAISGWLPDTREEFDTANRQTAYRAMSNLKGITADVELAITLIHPGSAQADWLDRAGITGICRMKRLRPGAPMGLLHGSSISPPRGTQRLALDGQPSDPLHGSPLLAEFSSQPTPQFDVRITGNTGHYLLRGDDVGIGSFVDLFLADIMRHRYPVHRGVSPHPATPGAVIDIPVKTLIVDVLVHQRVWPGVEPELRMYDTTGRGLANPTDPARDMDRIDVFESIQDMGTRLDSFRTKEVGRYVEMIRHVCDRLGWDSTCFRGYRCRVDYPVHGTQVSMIFVPPAPPTG